MSAGCDQPAIRFSLEDEWSVSANISSEDITSIILGLTCTDMLFYLNFDFIDKSLCSSLSSLNLLIKPQNI
jgi:hypothetical protein